MIARLTIATLAACLAVPTAAAETYVIDPVHSQPQFEVQHMGFSHQQGSLGKASGTIVLDRAAKKGSVDVTIDLTAVRTFDTRLDAVVKGERFFNVEKHPTATFKSTNVTFDGDRPVSVQGDLTLVGVTKPVTLNVGNFHCGDQPFNKKPMCAADATTTIKRSEFGITDGLKMNNPGDDVKITIPVEAYLQQPQG